LSDALVAAVMTLLVKRDTAGHVSMSLLAPRRDVLRAAFTTPPPDIPTYFT